MIDLSSAQAFLKTVRYPGCDVTEQSEYIQAHLTRIFDTFRIIDSLNLTPDQTVLDIGAKPYMLAALVKKYSRARFIGVGYSIEEVRDVQTKSDNRTVHGGMNTGPVPVTSATINLEAQGETLPIEMWQCNVETDPLPLDDNSVDVAVFGEILEHLIFNPSLIIAEMNRVLKPGGTAIVTTPNQLYWVRMAKLLLGKNIDDPYSIHGPYGRHNRNYTPKELNTLYTNQGFTMKHWTTKTHIPLITSSAQRTIVTISQITLAPVPSRRGKTYIGVFTKNTHSPTPSYPAWLYH